METTDMRATAFGRVVGEIMESRGIPAEPKEIKALAERAGFDGEDFLARVASGNGPDLGDLGGLDREMALSQVERDALAMAYTFEKGLACAVPGCERLAALGNGLGDCEGHREAYDARAELEAWRRFAHRVLEPWTTATREIGSDELTGVMEDALGEAEEAVAAARDRLERAEAALGG
jgi:hypothetical protein